MRRTFLGLLLATVLLSTFILALEPDLKASSPSDERIDVERPNVIVIGIDSVRADHMPCHGYRYNTTPNICRFASENILFEEAIAQSGWTHPSVASLFTGQYPDVHGMVENYTSIREESPVLAQVLKDAGYRTVAFPGYRNTSTPQDHLLLPLYGFSRGFEEYDDRYVSLSGNVPAAIDWIENGSSESFFLYVQGYEPHRYKHPVQYSRILTRPPEESPLMFAPGYSGPLRNRDILSRVSALNTDIVRTVNDTRLVLDNGTEVRLDERDIDYIRANYDYRLRRADGRLGEFFDAIEERGMMNDTIIVFYSSHGEYLHDPAEIPIPVEGGHRAFGHAGVSEGEIHVPLAMHVPGIESREIEEQVELMDVMPTLLSATGTSSPSIRQDIQAESLLPLLRGRNADAGPAFVKGGWGLYAARTENYKYIAHPVWRNRLYRISEGSLSPANDSRVMESMDTRLGNWFDRNHDFR